VIRGFRQNVAVDAPDSLENIQAQLLLRGQGGKIRCNRTPAPDIGIGSHEPVKGGVVRHQTALVQLHCQAEEQGKVVYHLVYTVVIRITIPPLFLESPWTSCR
jgi:hypothetical protein